ncbi:MAG: glycosyltransferase family 2 protein [Phaeodactylibacter sp.]|nr:glycosyltransferase family 2 protein [Phaeodactylibacter sp.]MCB0611992.1 glycosyltransferase family 2 protein [Phaeodactylibacter sp.]MCB9275722.1 glycosyltransferase family 2 protein [Lewinellaceae bacterium]
MIKLSVVVITFNEADNIGRCLDSVQKIADDILVVDSFSTDTTVDIAREKGARVIQNPWEDYHKQRGFAVQHAQYDHVLALDADEFLSDALEKAVGQVKGDWQHEGYRIYRMNRIGDTWLHHTSWYPDPTLRLFDRRKVTFETMRGHDLVVVTPGGSTGLVKAPLMHHSNYNLHDRMHRLNQQSTEAARFYFERGRKGSWLRILLKPLGRFLVELVLRRGFLGGFYGFAISVTAAHYVFLRETKLMEMHRLGRSYSKDNWRH